MNPPLDYVFLKSGHRMSFISIIVRKKNTFSFEFSLIDSKLYLITEILFN